METLSQDLDTQEVAAIRTQTSNFWHIIYGEKRKIAFQLGPGMGVSLNCDCQGRGSGRGAVFSSIHRRRTTSVLCFGGAMANENSKIIAAAEGASRIPEARSQSQSQHH